MKTTLLILSKNEIEGLKLELPRIKREWVDQILVVDNSNDGSAEYATSMGCEVYRQLTTGLRHAYQEVWPLIKGDWVITYSPDGNSPPEYIPQLINKMKEGYDMVIGSRYHNGDWKSEDDGIVTAFGNWLFKTVINFLFNFKYTDAMTMYRIYKKDLFYTLDLNKDSTYYKFEKLFFTKIGVEPILSTRFAKNKLNLGEIYCREPVRVGGKRKLQVIRWGLAYMGQVLYEKIR
ncbi:MAG: glycosyltransferase family 2 protein [Oligoflexia bacterium]|nr:glycosyltransferase family 2 protein [Oligoflexia bacterium]